MSRYEIVEYEQATSNVKEIYDEVKQILGTEFLPNWIKCMGNNENLLRGNWEKAKGTLVQGDLPHLLKELIIFSISKERGSAYCQAAHAHSALQMDKSLTYNDLLHLLDDDSPYNLLPSHKAAIKVALKAAVEPNSISDNDFQELREEGFSDDEIQEILAQADLTVMFNTITSAANLEIDESYRQ